MQSTGNDSSALFSIAEATPGVPFQFGTPQFNKDVCKFGRSQKRAIKNYERSRKHDMKITEGIGII